MGFSCGSGYGYGGQGYGGGMSGIGSNFCVNCCIVHSINYRSFRNLSFFVQTKHVSFEILIVIFKMG